MAVQDAHFMNVRVSQYKQGECTNVHQTLYSCGSQRPLFVTVKVAYYMINHSGYEISYITEAGVGILISSEIGSPSSRVQDGGNRPFDQIEVYHKSVPLSTEIVSPLIAPGRSSMWRSSLPAVDCLPLPITWILSPSSYCYFKISSTTLCYFKISSTTLCYFKISSTTL
jgi:hypothetical protein